MIFNVIKYWFSLDPSFHVKWWSFLDTHFRYMELQNVQLCPCTELQTRTVNWRWRNHLQFFIFLELAPRKLFKALFWNYFFQSLLVWIGLSVTATEPNKTYEPSQKSDPYETSETSEASETSDIVSFYGVDSMVYPIDGIDVENSFRRIWFFDKLSVTRLKNLPILEKFNHEWTI